MAATRIARRALCVNCGCPVRLPAGAKAHDGHVDADLDRRIAYTDGTYVAADVASLVHEAHAALRRADYVDVVEALAAAARAAGPGRLAERLACLRDCAQAELVDADDAAVEHDYRWETIQIVRELRGQSVE